MENTPSFARPNAIENLDAKLHQGYDPSIEHREQGTLFGNVIFDGNYQQQVPDVDGDSDDKNNIASQNIQANENNVANGNQRLIPESATAHVGYAPNDGAGVAALGFNSGATMLDDGSFGGSGFSQPVGSDNDQAVLQQNLPGFGGDVSGPSPSSSSNGNPENPNPPENEGDPVFTAPVVSTQSVSGDEDQAVQLIINVVPDTEPGIVTTVTIFGVPTGAVLSAGTNNGNGSWTLTLAQLVGLTLTPSVGFSGGLGLSVIATSTLNGMHASTSKGLSVTIEGVATPPTLSVQGASGDENTPIPLNITANLVDNDGSETLSITIGNVPTGAILSAGINNGDGTWTLTPAQLAGLTITPPPGSDADFTLTVTATSSENGTTASVSQNLTVEIGGIASTPNLNVGPASGDEGTPIPLTISASLTDNDGSETLSITIGNVPTGAILSAGINNGDGTWTLTPAQLAGLTITPPPGSDADFTLTVTATSSENGTTASVNGTIAVTVEGISGTPILSIGGTATGAEDTPIALTINASLSDNDGSEVLSIVVGNVPSGAVLSAGLNNGDGTWTLSPADLVGLTITPPQDYSGTMNLVVTAISTETANGNEAQVSAACPVVVTPVADAPDVAVQGAVGFEDQAIALDVQAALSDTDGSEMLSILISGVPSGVVLSAGINNGNGSWTLTPAQLSGLYLMTASNNADDFDVTVTAISRESDNTTSTQSAVLHVAVEAVADMPTVFATNTSGATNSPVAISIGGSATDMDGSESVTFIIDGVPDGFSLSAGINNGDNSWTLTQAELSGLRLIAPYDFEGRVFLTAQAVAHEVEGDTEISAPASFNVGFGNAASGLQINLAIGLGVLGIGVGVGVGIGVNLGGLLEPDGVVAMEGSTVQISEAPGLITAIVGLVSYLTFSGVPVGATFNHGVNLGGGVWQMTVVDLNNLQLQLPPDSSQDFTLQFNAHLLTLVTVPLATTVVHVVGMADVPTLAVANVAGNEDGGGIALNITAGLTDVDGSEKLSITIKDLPPGFHLSAGIDNGDRTWSLTPAQLAGLVVIPPHDYSGTATYTVVATSTENEGDSSAVTATGQITVNPTADAPLIATTSLNSAEDQTLALNLGIGLADTDGSEHISAVIVSGVPAGASVTHATDLGGGVWSLDVAQLGSVQLVPPSGWHGDIHLSVTATSQETIGGSQASTTSSVTLQIEAVADTPTITASNESGYNDVPIGLHISAGLSDTDGSETLSVVISGVPDGSVLSAGLNNGDGSWTLHASDLTNLAISPPHGFSGDMHLSITSYATETSNGDTQASAALDFTVHVDEPQAMMSMMMFFAEDSSGGIDSGLNTGFDASAGDMSAFDAPAAPIPDNDNHSNAFQDSQHQAG